METEKMTGYPSIDKPWAKYYSQNITISDIPQCTVYKLLYENNKEHLSDIAIKYYGNKISYRELFEKTEQCAKSLKSAGVNKGDCVTICSAGAPEIIMLFIACSKIGAIANFVNPLFSKEQMVARINDTNSQWLFVLDKMFEYIENAIPETCIKNTVIVSVSNSMPKILGSIVKMKNNSSFNVEVCNKYTWSEFIDLGRNYSDNTEEAYIKDRPVLMVYSSGSTGASKGILLTNDGIISTFYDKNIPPEPTKRGEVFLQMIPVWFSTGIVISVLVPLLCGFTVVPELVFSKESFCKDLKKYKPNLTLTATSLWLYAVSDNGLKNADLSCLTCPITGGEKILPQDEQRINEFLNSHGCKCGIFKGYGMCELGGTVTSTSGVNNYKSKPGGAGYPIQNVVVSAFDVNTNEELKYGVAGELRALSPGRMKEYYKNQEATDEYFFFDKQSRVWGCTGDVGYVDEDGEVFVLGRVSDSTTMDNGKTIYLFNVEEIILKEKTVTGCKVVPIKENEKTVLVAHITIQEDETINKEAIIKKVFENCKKYLSEEERPVKYKIRKSFPVHPNGKRNTNALLNEKDGFELF